MPDNHIKYALVFMQAFVCLVLLAFYHYSWSGYSLAAFIWLTVLVGIGCFYRPRWAFWFFVGLLPFEALSLTEGLLPLSIRPYQVVGSGLFLAIVANLLIGRTSLRLPSFNVLDGFVLLIPLGGFLGALFAVDTLLSLRLVAILCTFVGMYFATRFMVTKLAHLRMPLKFLSISALTITIYGIVQNFTFLTTGITTAIMPGRPNATFTEADWFGMFLAFMIACCFSLWYFFLGQKSPGTSGKDLVYKIVLWFAQVLFFVGLILSVARSAWVSVGCLIVVYGVFCLYRGDLKSLRFFVMILLSSAVVAYGLISLTGLSRFDFSNRAQSTTSGLQEITIACLRSQDCSETSCSVPAVVDDIEQLRSVGCHFIDLEDIESEKSSGMIVTTTSRPDPNIEIRKRIFSQSLDQIKEHPFIGIGWGSINSVLGEDESGTALNSSNIFLQVWLGSGMLGLIGLIGSVLVLVHRSLQYLHKNTANLSGGNRGQTAYGIFILLGGVAIIVSNFFNAGMLIGFLWVYLGFTQIIILRRDYNEKME